MCEIRENTSPQALHATRSADDLSCTHSSHSPHVRSLCCAVGTGSDHLRPPPQRAPSSTRRPGRRFATAVRAPSSRASSPQTSTSTRVIPAANPIDRLRAHLITTIVHVSPCQPATSRISPRQLASARVVTHQPAALLVMRAVPAGMCFRVSRTL